MGKREMKIKKILAVGLMAFGCLAVQAQMSRWVVRPNFDTIFVANQVPMIVCDSLGVSRLLDFNGKRVSSTRDQLHPFVEGYAVTTVPGTERLTGFFDATGRLTKLQNMQLAYPGAYFSDGYLLVRIDNGYRFINGKGEIANFGQFVKAYPFSHGITAVAQVDFDDKRQSQYYRYITTDNEYIELSVNGKRCKPEETRFLSAINEEGVGVAVIKDKVYYFNADDRSLQPVYTVSTEDNAKRQMRVEGELREHLVPVDGTFVLKGVDGKKSAAAIAFDGKFAPMAVLMVDTTVTYSTIVPPKCEYSSSMAGFKGENGLYGLKYNGKTVMPAQFDEIDFCLNDMAVVRKGLTWGIATYDPNVSYRFTMHDGNGIAFRHKNARTTLKLELPVGISADCCEVDIPAGSGCAIDKSSVEIRNTREGNYVKYECILDIPKNLPDELTTVSYPAQVTYDRIVQPLTTVEGRAWHYKYINVQIDDTQTKVEKGNVSFVLDIVADTQAGDIDYPFTLELSSDSINTQIDKISERKYKCMLYSLPEGVGEFEIRVFEEGCPPSRFPYSVTYTKSAGRTRASESVTIESR